MYLQELELARKEQVGPTSPAEHTTLFNRVPCHTVMADIGVFGKASSNDQCTNDYNRLNIH